MKEGVLSVPGSLYGGQHHGAPLPGAQADIYPLQASFQGGRVVAFSSSYTFTTTPGAYSTEAKLAVVRAPFAFTVSAAHLTPSKASSGSNASNYWESYIRNTTAANDLCSSKWVSNGSELAAGVAKDLAANQNLAISDGAVLAGTIRSVGTPTTMQHTGWNWTIKGNTSILSTSLGIGISPAHTGRVVYSATRIWLVLDTAESGADGSNYTTAEFRYGPSFASYTVLGSVNTQDNPGAGVPVTASLTPVLMEAGQVLFAVLTRTGSGSVDFATARVTIGVDFRGVRKA